MSLEKEFRDFAHKFNIVGRYGRGRRFYMAVCPVCGGELYIEYEYHGRYTDWPELEINLHCVSECDISNICKAAGIQEDELVIDDLPPIVSMVSEQIPLNGELIEGVLRRGHKMIFSGPSKAGKSFGMIELCSCIGYGTEWLGFQCVQGKVLYVNLELDRASCIDRFAVIKKSMGLHDVKELNNIHIWNLRGYTMPLDKLSNHIIARCKNQGYDAIIIDPIYKVLTGSENNAYDMMKFTSNFDRIAAECDCACIYAHHHSKGDQSWKTSIDRMSGSGVFARDADAIIDMTELELPPDQVKEGCTAWRITGTLREFKAFAPRDVWFNYPLHIREEFDPETVGTHSELPSWRRAMYARKSKAEKARERQSRLRAAWYLLKADDIETTVKNLSDYMECSKDTVRRMVDSSKEFTRENGIVKKV